MTSEERLNNLLDFLKEDPSDVSAKYMIALEYIKASNDIEAHRWMEKIYSDHPSYLPNYYHYGKLLERKGDFENALLIYNHGIVIARDQKNLHTVSELSSACEGLDGMTDDK